MKSYQIRDLAKDYLTGGWKTFAITTFLYVGILLIFSYVPMFFNVPYILSMLLQGFINIILTYGLLSVFWNYSKRKDIKFYSFLLIAFENVRRSILLFLFTAIRLIVPFILTILSTIFLTGSLKGFLFLQVTSTGISPLYIVILILASIAFVLSFTLFFVKALEYSVNNLVAIESPELKEKECVLKSKELMKGNRKKYLFLLISFTGWFIVGIFTLLIGFLWIFPYLQMSIVCFYKNIQNKESSQNKHKNKRHHKRKK